MTNRLAWTVAIGCVAMSQPGVTQAQAPKSQIDDGVRLFFDELRNGKATAAVDDLLGKSTLVSGKIAEKAIIANQATTAIQAYGAIAGIDLVDEATFGQAVVRRRYTVQHANMVTRWEFEFARLPAGWACIYVGFDDQVRTWF